MQIVDEVRLYFSELRSKKNIKVIDVDGKTSLLDLQTWNNKGTQVNKNYVNSDTLSGLRSRHVIVCQISGIRYARNRGFKK